jgi:hypothetical protein
MAAKKKSTRYGKTAGKKVEATMDERKHGTLRSGGSGKKVTSKKQAIAIGLSEARKAGGKVPPNPNAKKSGAKKSTAKKKTAGKTTAKKKTAAKKAPAKTSTSAKKKTATKKTATKKTAKKKTASR